MSSVAHRLAAGALAATPDPVDLELAERSLIDTVGVTLAARYDPIGEVAALLPKPARWGALAHVLDFDDLHLPSTTHISAVCVPAVLAVGGGAHAYLAAAGIMARLGNALGWSHYERGWHATCTAGAPAAAAGAAVALGLDGAGIARAMALAVPAAGGVQRAFGTSAKSLQVGFAVDAGVRAALLAARGATADPTAVDQWLGLLGVDAPAVETSIHAEIVPGGLAIKLFPCCYALQRPIAAVRELLDPPLDPGKVTRIDVRTPAGTVQPLIHHRPTTGLQAKFSLEYAIAATLLDREPGFDAFTDAAVDRPEAAALVRRVVVHTEPGGEWLLDGEIEIAVQLDDEPSRTARLGVPPGAPQRPPTTAELRAKIEDCCGDLTADVMALTWEAAPGFLDEHLAVEPSARPREYEVAVR